jgi:hypothetical protein
VSENADEIEEGLKVERSPLESHSTPEMQSVKLLVEQMNVEFAWHAEAF